jgi:hypothetical protein
MISDFYEDVDVIVKEQTSDDLGGFKTQYTKIATVAGLLQRSSTSERTIAAQLGVSSVYTFMTTKNAVVTDRIKQDVILRSKSITAIVTSDELDGAKDTDMADVAQWQAQSYSLPSDVVVVDEK